MGYQIDPSYKEVPERIRDFRAKHPEGSLQSEVITWPTTDLPFVAVLAKAFRTPDDERPGIGLAWEPVPGTTPYTKNSELQNAETSAWGRAIIAVLASESKHIASAEDVRNRAEERETSPPAQTGEKAASAGAPATSDGAGAPSTPAQDDEQPPAPEGQHKRRDATPCAHPNLKPAKRDGFYECPDCHKAGPARYFDKVPA